MILRLAGIALAVLCIGALWLHLAPISVDAVHRMGTVQRDVGNWEEPEAFEAVRQVPAPRAVLADLVRIATVGGGTQLLEGSAEEGLVTLVTRGALLGLPDITNLWIEGDRVHLRGHSVYALLPPGTECDRAAARIGAWLTLAGL